MIPLIVGTGTFFCVFCGALAGMWLRQRVPPHYRDTDSQDAIKLTTGMLSVLAALVLGLLTSSVRGNFDEVNAEVSRFAAELAMLDQTLQDMGPQTDAARDLLHHYTALSVEDNWPDEAASDQSIWTEAKGAVVSISQSLGGTAHLMWLEGTHTNQLLNALRLAVIALPGEGEANRALRDSAIRLTETLVQSRWVLHQRTQSPLLPSFVLILTFWTTAIFLSFGYNAPCNAPVVVAFFISAAALAACFYLLVEMDIPFSGVLRISSHAMRDALDHMGR